VLGLQHSVPLCPAFANPYLRHQSSMNLTGQPLGIGNPTHTALRQENWPEPDLERFLHIPENHFDRLKKWGEQCLPTGSQLGLMHT
jgi:hypothetical protein